MKIADAMTMREIDRAAMDEYGVHGLQLMENAGRGVAEAVKREMTACAFGTSAPVLIVAGKGNNGGDGYVAARHLKNSGCDVMVFSLAPVAELKGDAALNARAWRKMGGEVRALLSEDDLKEGASLFRSASVIVDAIFGTGLASPVKGIAAKVIDLINGLDKKVVAVDVPSGIDASTGAVFGLAVRACITATMALPKIGLYTYPGRSYAGRVDIVDTGVPARLLTDVGIRWNLLCREDVKGFLRSRPGDS
ncbi:MAG: NAD(P)H-hydrate epimerase, partial [Deltaproteobacteria bacterium]